MLTAKNKYILFLVLLPCFVQASESQNRHIEVYDSTYPRDSFKKIPNSTVHFHAPGKSSQSVPSNEVRNKAFVAVAGLSEKVKGWQEMDKDILYMQAKHSTLATLKQSYPKLDENTLRELKKQIAKQP